MHATGRAFQVHIPIATPDAEKDRFAVAGFFRDQGRNAHLVRNPLQDRSGLVRGLFVAEIHARLQPDIDAARCDPEGHMRCHRATDPERDRPRFDGLENKLAGLHIAGAAARSTEVRISFTTPVLGTWTDSIGVSAPDFDQSVAPQCRFAIENPTRIVIGSPLVLSLMIYAPGARRSYPFIQGYGPGLIVRNRRKPSSAEIVRPHPPKF